MELDFRTSTPLDPTVLAAMAAVGRLLALQALAFGSAELSFEWFSFSALLTVGFFGLLRPGELTALRADLVQAPTGAPGEEPFAVVAIERPKGRPALGKVQIAAIRDVQESAWLARTAAEARPSAQLWPGGYRQFSRRFQQVVVAVGVNEAGYSPTSLRAGVPHTSSGVGSIRPC